MCIGVKIKKKKSSDFCICVCKMLMKKIGTLAKALEVESKKVKREAAIREKDSALTKVDEKMRNTNSSKRLANTL